MVTFAYALAICYYITKDIQDKPWELFLLNTNTDSN